MTTLTSANLNPLINNIVASLNKGDVVLPSSIYLSMLQEEVHHSVDKLEESVRSQVKRCCEGMHKISSESQVSVRRLKDRDVGDDLKKMLLESADSVVEEIRGVLFEFVTEEDAASYIKAEVDDVVASELKGAD